MNGFTMTLIFVSFFEKDMTNRCRWSTNAGEPHLLIKYNMKYLNVLDSETKTFIMQSPIQIGSGNHLYPHIYKHLSIVSSLKIIIAYVGWNKYLPEQ